MSWLTKIMARSLLISSNNEYSLASNRLSMYVFGSSKMITSGLETKARPSKARWSCPPLNSPIARLSIPSRPI